MRHRFTALLLFAAIVAAATAAPTCASKRIAPSAAAECSVRATAGWVTVAAAFVPHAHEHQAVLPSSQALTADGAESPLSVARSSERQTPRPPLPLVLRI